MSFLHDLNNLYAKQINENVTGGGAQPLPSVAPAAQRVAPPQPVLPVPQQVKAPSQQEQQPVRSEHITFDFVNDRRRAHFFAHLVYNAIYKVSRQFELVNEFVDELSRIHRRERRNR